MGPDLPALRVGRGTDTLVRGCLRSGCGQHTRRENRGATEQHQRIHPRLSDVELPGHRGSRAGPAPCRPMCPFVVGTRRGFRLTEQVLVRYRAVRGAALLVLVVGMAESHAFRRYSDDGCPFKTVVGRARNRDTDSTASGGVRQLVPVTLSSPPTLHGDSTKPATPRHRRCPALFGEASTRRWSTEKAGSPGRAGRKPSIMDSTHPGGGRAPMARVATSRAGKRNGRRVDEAPSERRVQGTNWRCAPAPRWETNRVRRRSHVERLRHVAGPLPGPAE